MSKHVTQQVKTLAGMGLAILLLPHSVSAQTGDLLGGDDFLFNSSEIDSVESHWSDGLKTTLEHSHTETTEATREQRSHLRLEFETGFAGGWFIRLDTRYRYFWSEDRLAENRGNYGKNEWQNAWLQYSHNSCAAKVGRQTLIWGTVEGTFVTDIITPFDYTEQLLTDFGNVREPQDMLVGDCFFGADQVQVFFTPEAKTDVLQHEPLALSLAPGAPPISLDVDAGQEWGLRYKWSREGYDISAMYARLFSNTPTLVMAQGAQLPTAELSEFDMYGLGVSIARGRLLIKGEAAFKTEQLVSLSNETTDQIDVALGFEYTTQDNHAVSAGLWSRYQDNDVVEHQQIGGATLSWRKPYLNDNLIMSLLGNWASEPRFLSLTIFAEYQWDDYWSSSLALGTASLSKAAQTIPFLTTDDYVTAGIKYEF
ncbi:DUF1302 family protein [Zhongshania arctica]|uniref:DUF1302 family protein n=1 Tax=Zhongshania arctica TaxID=3238302 RepID=A0ABV3TUG4_9GAMM